MNVGSILNDDTPAPEPQPPLVRAPTRNSIGSLLNDEKSPSKTPSKTPSNPPSPAPPAQAKEPEEDEIAKLSKLKGKTKPRRYVKPPIWAQEWSNRFNDLEISDESITQPSQLSNKPILNNTITSVDLECSITGVIPPPSVTRRIAEWIYANFIEITEANRPKVELELKFGTILNKTTNNRIDISVSTECIYTDSANVYFEPGIHEVGFNELLRFFDELEANQHQEKGTRKFNQLVSNTTDSIYYVRNRNELPKMVRISKDNKLNPPRYTGINKVRMSDLFIHNPSSMYDLRLSLSMENPIQQDEIDTVLKKQKPTKVRVKDRKTFKHKQTITQFDLTKVKTPRSVSAKTMSGNKVVETDQTYEVELEVDVLELFNGFDLFKNGVNSVRFEELVEIFLNNGRILNNRITRLAK